MTDSEAAFVKNLLEMEMDGLPIEKKTKVRMAFHKNKITFAEMSPNKKYKIDHRFKAFKKIKKFL